ncbi:PP2C family protein-serine/threonine phosphatase [Leptospira andrefontaineae]|uniref:Serine/threonine-protein phosphatase n=1 Tax=Leptospira andrefontaineae TaxID=2484976 RepID=A0A4R9H2V5_9LEPT|nr:PP2C family protein-serine/threonine phosphatase [Leptospira andrefontaineae]TGK39015.1 serine/threonine-protein phosphatase [Leptospira andrefontaineae]
MKSKLGICIFSVLLSIGTNTFFHSLEYREWIYSKLFPTADQNDPCKSLVLLEHGWEVSELSGKKVGIFSLPKNFSNLGHSNLLISNSIHFSELPDCELSLHIGKTSEGTKVFWNGILLSERSEFYTRDNFSYDKRKVYDSIPILTENRIEILVSEYFENELGILEGIVSLGDSKEILHKHYKFQIYYLILISTFLLLGIYLVFLSLQEGKIESHFHFGVFLILFFLFSLFGSEWKYELDWDFLFCKKAEYISLSFLFPFFTFFFSKFCRDKHDPFEFPLFLWAGFVSFLYIHSSSPLELDKLNRTLLQPSWIVYLWILFKCLKTRLPEKDGSGFLGSICFLVFSILLDIGSARAWIIFPRSSEYSILGFILFCSFRISGRFVEMKNRLNLWNEKLQEEVTLKTKELSESLVNVSNLKEKQDGDYFLMSVLQSCFQNKIRAFRDFKIETLVSQYKTFEFKSKPGEIGGDLVCVEEIRIGARKLLAILNADAMGKSIQGATGALLASSMFKSHIDSSSSGLYTPETWIVSLYRKIHGLFESFDGNLFATGVLAVLDPENSSVFFLNAGHPPSIFLRKNISGFIENEISYKMGIPLLKEIPKVYCISLKENDSLIFGSDGREDLRSRTITREVNSFSEPFLLEVSNTNADLILLKNRMYEYGDYIDDLSLVRIFRNINPQSKSREIWRETSKRKNLQKGIHLWKKGDKKIACSFFSKLCNEYPTDKDLAYITAWAHWKTGEWEKAKTYSEKLLYRDLKNHQNLILLAKIYFQLGISDVILIGLLEGSGLDVQRLFRPTDYLRKVS